MQHPIMAHGQLEKYFSEDAVSRLAACIWDPIKKCVVSAADNTVNALSEDLDLDDKFRLTFTDTSKFELDITVVQ
jgi:hypothetical protein